MLKYLLVSLLFLFISQFALANKVDDLKTDKDVAKFVMANTQSEAKWYKGNLFVLPADSLLSGLKHCEGLDNSIDIKNWTTLDINHDSFTDLLVFVTGVERRKGGGTETVKYLFVDKGNNKFSFSRIERSMFSECEYAIAKKKGEDDILLFYYMKALPLPKGKPIYNQIERLQKDTLTYKFGTLLEYNSRPAELAIDSIIFETGRCFGECPVFKIQFSKNGNALYHGGKYNTVLGDFKTTIKSRQLKQFFEVLNYINVIALDNEYAVPWTDDQPCWLTIKFTDGSVKKIHDYGMIGTFGLRRLYKFITDMRTNQNWNPVE